MFSLLRGWLLQSARRWILIGVLQRNFNGKSSSARIYTPYYLLCLHFCVIYVGNYSWFTDGKHCFTKIHNSLLWIIHENAPWSSAAKSMLPGNEKCFMTSLPDTKHIFRERKIYLRNLEFLSWLRPRAVSRLRARFARNKIIKSLRSELTSPGYVDPQGCNQYDHKECWFVKTHHCTSNEVPVHATYPVFFYYQTLKSDAIWRNINENETLWTNYKGRVWSETIIYFLSHKKNIPGMCFLERQVKTRRRKSKRAK